MLKENYGTKAANEKQHARQLNLAGPKQPVLQRKKNSEGFEFAEGLLKEFSVHKGDKIDKHMENV